MPQIDKKFKINKTLSPLYFFYGTQSYLMNVLKNQVLHKALSAEEMEFNLSIYDMEETPVDLAIEDAETLPFIGEKRVVVINRPYFLTGERIKQKVEHNLSQLEAYIENPSPETVFIVIAPYEKLDKRKKLVKGLLKHAETFELTKLSDDDLYQILLLTTENYQVNFSREAFNYLLELVGPNISQLVNEVEKMALYAGENGDLTVDIINNLVSKSLESNVFTLIDHIMTNQLSAAYRLVYDLIKLKEEPIKLLALISRQFRIVFQVSLYKKQGYAQKQIATMIKVHPFAVKIAAKQAMAYSEESLRKALDLCTETDYIMKTGQMDKTIALELLIHQLGSLQK